MLCLNHTSTSFKRYTCLMSFLTTTDRVEITTVIANNNNRGSLARWFVISGHKILSTKKITGIKVVSVKYGDGGYENDLIHARISWRPVSMSAKKFLYTVSWTPENCEDKSKKLRAKVRVSLCIFVDFR